MLLSLIKKYLFKIIRKLEKYPEFILFILNNISYFKFLLPHDKDYYGMKLIFKKKNLNSFLDIGANTGTSTLGFLKMGFCNKIYLFEPNFFLFERYLKKIKKNHANIDIYNLALGSKNSKLNFYMPFIDNVFIHYFSSFSKSYVKNSCLKTFPNKKISIKRKIINVKKFDDLGIVSKIDFIKIDTEGHDLEVIKGMKKTIKKFKPVLLIEFNKNIFQRTINILQDYSQYFYNLEKNSLIKIKNSNMYNLDRFGHKNSLSSRNIYFIHKSKRKMILC